MREGAPQEIMSPQLWRRPHIRILSLKRSVPRAETSLRAELHVALPNYTSAEAMRRNFANTVDLLLRAMQTLTLRSTHQDSYNGLLGEQDEASKDVQRRSRSLDRVE